MLLADLGLADFMDRSLAELQRDEVLTPEVVSAICQGYIAELTKGGAPDAEDKELRRLEDTERSLASLDEAERLLAALGDNDWYERVELVLQAWRDLTLPTPSTSELSIVFSIPHESPDVVDYCVRTWAGCFALPGGRSYSILNVVEPDIGQPTDLDSPFDAHPDISAVTRRLRKIQGSPSLTLYADRGHEQNWEASPREVWAKGSVRTNSVSPLTLHEIYALLSTAEFAKRN